MPKHATILALAAAMLLGAPAAANDSSGTVEIRLDVRQVQFFDVCDPFGSRACEPRIFVDGGGSTRCGDRSADDQGLLRDCGEGFSWSIGVQGVFTLQLDDHDPFNPDTEIDIRTAAGGEDVDITVDAYAAHWSAAGQNLHGCDDPDGPGPAPPTGKVQFGKWCILGDATAQNNPPEGSVEIRITCISDCPIVF